MKLLFLLLILVAAMSGCSTVAGRGASLAGDSLPSSVRNSDAGVAAGKIPIRAEGNLDTGQLDRL